MFKIKDNYFKTCFFMSQVFLFSNEIFYNLYLPQKIVNPEEMWMLNRLRPGIIQPLDHTEGVLVKRCSENIQQNYMKTTMWKYDFNKVALQLCLNRTSVWVSWCKFAVYFQNTFISEHLRRDASDHKLNLIKTNVHFIFKTFNLFVGQINWVMVSTFKKYWF